jgi:hypothetical protein
MTFYSKFVATSTPVVRRGDANDYIIKQKMDEVSGYPFAYEDYFKTIFHTIPV